MTGFRKQLERRGSLDPSGEKGALGGARVEEKDPDSLEKQDADKQNALKEEQTIKQGGLDEQTRARKRQRTGE